MIATNSVKDDKWLSEALFKLTELFAEITRENEPEYYAWMMKWNAALRTERLAREKRMKIEWEEPPRR